MYFRLLQVLSANIFLIPLPLHQLEIQLVWNLTAAFGLAGVTNVCLSGGVYGQWGGAQ